MQCSVPVAVYRRSGPLRDIKPRRRYLYCLSWWPWHARGSPLSKFSHATFMALVWGWNKTMHRGMQFPNFKHLDWGEKCRQSCGYLCLYHPARPHPDTAPPHPSTPLPDCSSSLFAGRCDTRPSVGERASERELSPSLYLSPTRGGAAGGTVPIPSPPRRYSLSADLDEGRDIGKGEGMCWTPLYPLSCRNIRATHPAAPGPTATQSSYFIIGLFHRDARGQVFIFRDISRRNCRFIKVMGWIVVFHVRLEWPWQSVSESLSVSMAAAAGVYSM